MPFDLSPINFALIFLPILVIVFFYLAFYFYRLHIYHTKHIVPRTMDWVFLEILMPKESATDPGEQQARSKSEEEKKLMVGVAEQLFTALSESGHSKGWLLGKDYYSFEIACTDKKISFFVNCPRHLQELVEKQIQAQYPHAFVEEIKGYNPFQKSGEVETEELQLSKKYFYPFRTYKQTESDPLNAVTNAMSKLSENEGAAVQFIICPAGTSWQGLPRRMALEIQQGKNPEMVEKGHFHQALIGFARGLGKALSFGGAQNSQPSHAHKDLSGYSSAISLTPMQQEIVKKLEEKSSRPGYKVNIRLVTSSTTTGNAKVLMKSLLASFLQFNMPPFNGLRSKKRDKNDILKDYIFRVFRDNGSKSILNTEELASLWHLPTPYIETPNIKWLVSKKAPPPINILKEGLLIGKNVYRGAETPIYMGRDDRRRHTYVLGRTGSGKSVLLSNMAIQDIKNGEGICVIDPHGDLIQDILLNCPKERSEDIIVFEPFDMDRPLGLNMLEVDNEEQKDFAVQEMISIFYKLVTDPAMLGPMFEHNMRNAMLTLMADEEHPGTVADIPRIFTDTEFQKYKIKKLKDPVVRLFWEKEMAKTSDFHKSEMLGYLISKVGRFVENTMMRNIIGQPVSGFNFRKIMDEGKVLLVNLSKGRTGEINAKLLGLILVSKIQIAALSRADIAEEKRRDFYLYVDEFQNFITDAFSSILSEARKYRLNLIVAHQYLGQLEQAAGAQGAGSKDLRNAVFGNVGTMVVFRTGAEDAEVLGKEFAPTFNQFDLVNIDRYNAYVKLMVNGTASKPFNMGTMPPQKTGTEELANAIRQLSRLKFGRPRAEVEAELNEASEVAERMSEALPNVERGL
jgi:hypothetical protein